ncbi:hypothetical protein LJC48_05870 [Desulfovibrio sp. OttesenSCG-928-C06]|nr:hypothetical protein [Desulfovibrio sp. OttesenSCG-928-C06]
MNIHVKQLGLFLLAALLITACETPAQAKSKRVNCGAYSFILPERFTLVESTANPNEFQSDFTFQLPSNGKSASIICMREKKTEYYDYILFRKQNIRLQTAPRQFAKMVISATQNMTSGGLNYTYSILEETGSSQREVRGKQYIPVIEMNAADDEYHTMLMVSDARSENDFFNMEEYRSTVNKVATQIVRSMKKPAR